MNYKLQFFLITIIQSGTISRAFSPRLGTVDTFFMLIKPEYILNFIRKLSLSKTFQCGLDNDNVQAPNDNVQAQPLESILKKLFSRDNK